MRIIIAVALMLFWASSFAITIDFDELPPVELDGSDTIISQGYSFSAFDIVNNESSGILVVETAANFGSSGNALAFCPANCTLTMANISGSAFSLHSTDLVSALGPAVTEPYSVTGYFVGGGTISASIDIGTSFQTLALDSQWAGLEKVVFELGPTDSIGVLVDNVVVTAVPVPAAVWLFGSALAGLGWLRRK